MTVNNLKDLQKTLQLKITKALENEVTNKVKDVMVKHIEDDVYSKYTPSRTSQNSYDRRGIDEGLADPSNIGGVMVGDTLEVFNATVGNPDITINDVTYQSQNEGEYLTPIIEYGQGYDFSNDGNSGYEKPRPFVKNTRDELKQTKTHVKALKQGLKNQGINVD